MTVVALAGRRIDAKDAPARFPVGRIPAVRAGIRALLLSRQAEALVCSAACGADLVALEAAADLGIRRRVVLPFAVDKFRETSVVDGGKEWGSIFNRVIEEVVPTDDLVVLAGESEGTTAYAKANIAILDEALALAARSGRSQSVLAVIVWEGASRGGSDLTGHFQAQALARGLEVSEVSTG